MNTKIFALLLAATIIFASGCIGTGAGEKNVTVNSPAEASKAAQDVGQSVGEVAGAISDVDKSLGGTTG